MRFIFKTRYEQDIQLFPHSGAAFWYGLLTAAALAAPFLLASFYIGELSLLIIYAIAGLSVMLVVGYTGLVSLCHAAFLGIGAYAHVYCIKRGVPFLASVGVAGLLTGLTGALVALPAIRMRGLYLAIATLAFGSIVEQVFIRWESVTGGTRGMVVPKPNLFGWSVESETGLYHLCLAFLVLSIVGILNLLRAPTGRAFMAIRDSEIAAQSMGVSLARYKALAFSASAFLAGVAGALFAHKIGYLSPDIFTALLSIQLLTLVVVGGVGSIHGAIFGAIFLVLLPTVIAILRDRLPEAIAQKPALEPLIYGLVLVLFVLFEPLGIYGRWRKIKFFFSSFPLYKRATFKRQKAYMRTERLR